MNTHPKCIFKLKMYFTQEYWEVNEIEILFTINVNNTQLNYVKDWLGIEREINCKFETISIAK